MGLINSAVVFIIGLIAGGLGIHIGAYVTVGESEYLKAVETALIGAVIWTIIGLPAGIIPFIGPAIAFVAWLGVINFRYEGGWPTALIIAGITWASTLIILYALATIGIGGFHAIGVPGL